ncbi:hypothetical protein SAMN05216559_0518 [Halomicrobium zhouii]|uniref:Uncharacterized protein n=1 Tax=Halomicrobium zhouii TaxID=767519 RepID=A0A1I6KBR2_9EURY|nr:hypothetical protein [Halomicrobium zhouii]SFR88659.1 hypothetical protein SAMN05216559_0518 [Halomicrobium zhouii]
MQVICTDGTTFTCKGFELTEYGVALYGQNLAQEKERYDNEPEQTGYVPHDRLWYILPESVQPEIPPPGASHGQPGRHPPNPDQQPPTGQSPTGQPSTPPIQQLQNQPHQRPPGGQQTNQR